MPRIVLQPARIKFKLKNWFSVKMQFERWALNDFADKAEMEVMIIKEKQLLKANPPPTTGNRLA